jgi:hypothetical protein
VLLGEFECFLVDLHALFLADLSLSNVERIVMGFLLLSLNIVRKTQTLY